MQAPEINTDAKILLIENNPEQAAEMIKTIENHQIIDSVFWLEDGIQTMDYLLASGIFNGRDVKNTPEMIFLDLNISRKNVLEILYEIQTNSILKHIPVVLLCSTERELEWVKNFDLKVDHLILKPLDALGLTNVINNINRSKNKKPLQKKG